MDNKIEIIIMPDIRDKIFNSYQTTIEASLRENRSQIKLINFGTGSGKTYALFRAIYEAIKTYHPTFHIIGIYVAPLREHLQVPSKLESEYEGIPAYPIHSREMKMTDNLLNSYKKWIPSIRNDSGLWKMISSKSSYEKIQENHQNLSVAEKVIKRIDVFKNIDLGDEKIRRNQIEKAFYELEDLIEKFLQFLINSESDEDRWPNECLELVKIFYPLYLLREQSGIVMLTYAKFETTVPYFNFNGERWVKKQLLLDQYITRYTSDSRKFVLALDEQEDGYQIMLKKMIDIISPETLAINNALSSINREFSVLFSSRGEENRRLLQFAAENSGGFEEFEEYLGKNKIIEQPLESLAKIYQRLTLEEGNSRNFLEEMVNIITGLEQSLQEIAQIFEVFHEEKPVTFDFEMLHQIFSKFENNRSLLIPREVYEKAKHNLWNIFTFNDLYIYNIEPLKALFLTRCSSGHVTITEQKTPHSPSLAELIYAMFAVRLRLKAIKNFLVNVLNADDSQSRSLDIWANQVAKTQNARQDEITPPKKSDYLDHAYVYDEYKSIINIKEISRYQNPTNDLINRGLREVSIGNTAILASPEKKILSMTATGGNSIFLISATGGISGDLSTSYDMHYLEDALRDKESGMSSFKRMTPEEIRLCEEIREDRRSFRHVAVGFFYRDLQSFPNVQTQSVVERFEKMVLKNFIDSHTSEGHRFGIYKIQELQNFIRFLFYLFEDDSIREIFAFTQTLKWIKALIRECQLAKNEYEFKQSQEHPDIYYMHVAHKHYQSPIQIKLILYDASFNKRYNNNGIQKTYQDELCEKENEKIFSVSAYRSASKGFNPIVTSRDGEKKDFDCLALLMDEYYTLMGPSGKSLQKEGEEEETDKTTTIRHFACMKSLVALNQIIEIKKFSEYLYTQEAEDFRQKQHQILLGKGILQSIGRTERRDFQNQTIKIFINQETFKNLVNFHKYFEQEAPDEIQKLSVNNHAVYVSVQEEEQKHCVRDYDEHIDREIEAFQAIHTFRQKMLDEIEKFHSRQSTFDITKAWKLLRDSLVFQDPPAYLEKLRKTRLFPDDFIDALFYYNPDQAFTPYLKFERDERQKFWIISDSLHGEKEYPYQKRLYPEHLKFHGSTFDIEDMAGFLDPSTEPIYRLYRSLIPSPEVFSTYIPRYNFFYDVLYPALAEHFVAHWIKDVIFSGKDWKTIKAFHKFERLIDFKKYNILYERFDLYYICNETELRCIDVKAWSSISGNRLSKETVEKARKKIDAIAAEYSEFRSVKGLLLNLHADQEKNDTFSPDLFSGNLIFFDEQHFPVESKILQHFLFKGAL